MMRRWAVLGVLLGLAGAVLVHAPASWLAAYLASWSASRVQLAQPRGTVWSGNARLVLAESAGSADTSSLPGRVAWNLGWEGGALVLRVHADCCMQVPQRVHLEPSWRRPVARVEDGVSRWPANVLTGLGAPWNSLQPQGVLQLRTRGLSVEWVDGATLLLGQLELDALAMSSRLSTLRPVGSYRLTVSGVAPAGEPVLRLQTLEGPLRVVGQGAWTGSGWRFRGEASAEPRDESVLGNLLNMVGRRAGNKSVLSVG